jgi:hypothetical protein
MRLSGTRKQQKVKKKNALKQSPFKKGMQNSTKHLKLSQ